MSDKQKGLVEAVEQLLPGCEHRLCVMHLYKNFNQSHKGLGLKDLVWRAARSTRVVDFERVMNELKNTDVAAYNFLAQKPPSQWSKSHFSLHPKSDILLNNMSESFNTLILSTRSKSIISMLELIRLSLMRRIHERRDKMINYTGGDICPKISKLLDEFKKKSMEFVAHWNGKDQFEIESCHGTRYKLHSTDRTCSCRRWKLTGIPCPHAISGMYYLGQEPEDYVDEYYKRRTFLKTYGHLMCTLNGGDMWPKIDARPLKPPVATKLPGRPKKHHRKKDVTEQNNQKSAHGKRLSKKGAVMSCYWCKQPGHNARGCPLSKKEGLEPPTAIREDEECTQQPKGKCNSSMQKEASTGKRRKSVKAAPIPTPKRITRSSTTCSSVHVPGPDTMSNKVPKTLGVRRKLWVHKKVAIDNDVDYAMFPTKKSTSSKAHTTGPSKKAGGLIKPPWQPTGSSITSSVRFLSFKSAQTMKFKHVMQTEEPTSCNQM